MTVRDYHRPSSLDEALGLLGRTGVDMALLGGGTSLSAGRQSGPVEVVDLQALELDGLDLDEGAVRIGSMVRLQTLVDHASVPALLSGLAKREAANTIRNVGTVGGTIAVADYESSLVAGFLAHEGVVSVSRTSGSIDVPLSDLLGDRSRIDGGIITGLTIQSEGAIGYAATGRTPADRPIVSAVLAANGGEFRVALTGVAATPILIEPDAIGDLDPPGDFRGTSEYRKELARVLTARLIGEQTS